MKEFVYGRHAVYHLIAAGRRRPIRLHLLRSIEKEEPALLELARKKNVPLDFCEPAFFSKKLEASSNHQGVLIETEPYSYVDPASLRESSLLLILDEIQDPQNLGALCRSAHLFGVDGVILSESHAAAIGPGTCQASVGAVEYLRITRVSSIANYLELLKKHDFWTYGADAAGARSIREEDFPKKVALVIGSEEKGLRRLVRERCDILLKIPMVDGKIASLNASVAGGILLYEISSRKYQKS